VTSHEASICIPVFPNDQDVPALAARASAYLLAGHGLYTWGSSLAEAARHAVALEHLLACELDHEDEARLFAEGRGAFYLHTGGKVLVVVCERSDYLRVPAGTRH